jgi:hypothetical protein
MLLQRQTHPPLPLLRLDIPQRAAQSDLCEAGFFAEEADAEVA